MKIAIHIGIVCLILMTLLPSARASRTPPGNSAVTNELGWTHTTPDVAASPPREAETVRLWSWILSSIGVLLGTLLIFLVLRHLFVIRRV